MSKEIQKPSEYFTMEQEWISGWRAPNFLYMGTAAMLAIGIIGTGIGIFLIRQYSKSKDMEG